MKKITTFLVFVITAICVNAQAFEYEGLMYNILSEAEKTCEVAENSEASGEITIPKTVSYDNCQYNVISIGDRAFFYCTSLTSITLPEGVTSIGGRAFYNCPGLTSITLPEGVTSIDRSAFERCTGLTSITLPEGVTKIREDTFAGCTGLTSITLPETLILIDSFAFYDCSRLTSITLPEGVTLIGAGTFKYCSGLTSITLPESLTFIGPGAFLFCNRLEKVEISDLEAWCKINFSGNTANPLMFAGHLYLNGTEIKDLVIPPGVNAIGGYTFYNCRNLTGVTIPETVKEIGLSTFYGCSALTSIDIPATVTSISDYAFGRCDKLKTVNCYSTIPPACEGASFPFPNIYPYERVYEKGSPNECPTPEESESIFGGQFPNIPKVLTLHVPVGTKEAYASSTGWSKFEIIIEDLINDAGVDVIEADVNSADDIMVVYNMQGIRMNIKSKDELSNLPAGIYIVNGKKVLIK